VPASWCFEEYEHAKKRGARMYAEVIGYGLSGDAYHITSPTPDGDGAFRSMSAAMKRAGITSSDIDYINAHGTSTQVGDEIELSAVERLWATPLPGCRCRHQNRHGHLLGAAGAIECIFSVLAIRDNIAAANHQSGQPVDGKRPSICAAKRRAGAKSMSRCRIRSVSGAPTHSVIMQRVAN